MTENLISIRLATIKDVDAIVKVHLDSFPGFFLTFLGYRFLSELYAGIITDPTGIAFVSVEKNIIAGFVAGTSQPVGFYRRLLRHRWWRFAMASVIPVLKNPMIVPRLLRAFRKSQDTSSQADTGTLMSIAVVPDAQGNSMGKMLVKYFLEETARRGLKHVDLTTDKKGNDSVNQFYRRLGFQCSRTFFTPEGREMNEYSIDL